MGGKKSVYKTLFSYLLFVGVAHSQTIGYGEHVILNNKDSKTACAVAETKAISNAIESKYGYSLLHEQFKVCNKDCIFDSVSKIDITGKVQKILDKHSYVYNNICYATVKVVLNEERFLNAVVTGSDIHTSGTPIHYDVNVSEKMYMYVFARAGKDFDILFPVSYYDDISVSGKFTYPSYPVEIIPELSDNKTESREELIFLFTRFAVGFDRRRLSYDQLEELVSAIPNKSKRVIRRSTLIVR